MDFSLTEEQKAIVATTRAFVEKELYPHEEEVERTGVLRPELAHEIAQKALRAGLYAANMPEEAGGAGLDTVTWVLYEKELGRAGYVAPAQGHVPDLAQRRSRVAAASSDGLRERGAQSAADWPSDFRRRLLAAQARLHGEGRSDRERLHGDEAAGGLS